jgi:hypothetical protein
MRHDMKRTTIHPKRFFLLVLLSFFICNVADLRCENEFNASNKTQSQAKYAENRSDNKYDSEQNNDKSRRFEELELMIRHNLMKKYQQLDDQYQEEGLD